MIEPLFFANRLDDRACAIYLFHGVVERHTHPVRNYNRKHIARAEFIALLRMLRERGTPLTMDDVLTHCAQHVAFPPRSFALTFDDGFENNASVAAPILVDFRLPATFYVTTGWVGSDERSWVDRIEACLEYAAPGAVRLPWEERDRVFSSVGERIALLDAIRVRAKVDPSIDRAALVACTFQQCGVDEAMTWDDALDRKLSWAQVRALAAQDGFIVGGHTHSHAMLSFCTPADREREIAMSVRLLRECAGVVARHYAYPEGLAHHYDDAVIARLKTHSIVCCPTAIDGVNTHEADPFHLRRIPVMVDGGSSLGPSM